jgi:hypothetical protein
MSEIPIVNPDPMLGISLPSASNSSRPRLPATEASISLGIAKSLAAFEHERENLFRKEPYRWVAYRDGARLQIAGTQTELYRYCLRELGLSHDEFIVRCITPEEITEVEDLSR